MSAAKFVYVGNHAQDTLEGSVVGPGEEIYLTEEHQEHPFYKDMMANGQLIPTGSASTEAVEEAKKEAQKTAKKEGVSKNE